MSMVRDSATTAYLLISSPHKQQASGVSKYSSREFSKAAVKSKDCLDLPWECTEAIDDGVATWCERDTILGQLQCHEHQCNVL
jgi:hypothetical protein